MTKMTNETITCGLSTLYGTPVLVTPAIPGTKDMLGKRVLGALFMKEHGVWLYPAFSPYVFDVVRDLEIVIPNIQFTPEAEAHFDLEHARYIAATSDPIPSQFRDDFEFVTDPMAHQEHGLNFALCMLRCGIFYDCGLGKTKIVVDLMRHEREKTLVLVPSVGIKVWEKEIRKHADGELSVTCILGTPKKKMALLRKAAKNDDDVVVVGYDTAKLYVKQITETYGYRLIVADESHKLRGGNSARTKGAVALAAQANRRLLLSGTPSLGDPMHMWGQLQFLGNFIPGLNFWTFKKHFTVAHKNNPRFVVGYKNLDLLNTKVTRISTKKSKDECLDLPPRTFIDVPFEVTGDQRAAYNEIVEETVADIAEGIQYEAPHAAAIIQKLLQVLSGFFIVPPPDICDGCEYVKECISKNQKPFRPGCVKEDRPRAQAVYRMRENPKLDLLVELVDSILEKPEEKVIIWGYFVEELDIVEEFLKERDIGCVRVDGRNSSRAVEIGEQFEGDPKLRVYLANITTGTSVTLNSARYMIYFGLTYGLDEYLQSIDRNHRIGQDKPIFVYRLLAEKSVLAYVVAALERKIDIAKAITDRINCAVCARQTRCLDEGIAPFDEDCVYDDKLSRVITKPQTL